MNKILWLLPFALALPALAVIPQFWETRTYDQFRGGELDGLSVTGDGRLVLAPSFDVLFDTGEPIVFAAAADSGGNVYIGTGHNGKVFKVGSDGDATVLADLDGLDVMALTVSDDGVIFAATSPNGRVYRITADGSVDIFFEPGVRYIWSLVIDGSGRLLVATGDDGVIYRVDSERRSEILYDSEETHILTMAVDSDGNIIAGGDPRGYVYRISDSGEPFVLYDSSMREVRSVVVAEDGTIYAAVLSSGGGVPRNNSDAVSERVVPGAAVSVTVEGARDGFRAQRVQTLSSTANPDGRGGGGTLPAEGTGSGGPRSRILAITPEGAVDQVWESNDELVLSLLPYGDGLLFSTGTDGRIYSLEPPERATLLLESSEEQTTGLLSHGDRLFATSANAGRLFAVGSGARDTGSFHSTVRNTGATSSWGKVVWSGSGAELLTRSGNTSSPDSTWSTWEPIANDGSVLSPNARFLQWRAVLAADTAEDPMLTSVRIPYLQQNFRPEVINVNVLRSGIALETLNTTNNNAGAAGGPAGGRVLGRVLPNAPRTATRTVVRPGAQSFNWTATDENEDTLVYSIWYRGENEGEWKRLDGDLADSFYTVEPDTLADGTYVFRIVASDVGSNPPDLALVGAMETAPFAIDQTPPVVTVEQRGVDGGRVRLNIGASDGTSTLKQAEISVDAGRWRPVFPEDGIIDSQSEVFEFYSAPLGPGEHVIAFRIYDQNENVGIGQSLVRIQ